MTLIASSVTAAHIPVLYVGRCELCAVCGGWARIVRIQVRIGLLNQLSWVLRPVITNWCTSIELYLVKLWRFEFEISVMTSPPLVQGSIARIRM